MKRRKPLTASTASRPSQEEIKRMLHDRLPWLREEYGVGDLWLSVSYAQGQQHKRSDLDVRLEFEGCPCTSPPMNFRTFLRYTPR